MPDAAVIQQNYGEDDTESNLVTDKLDEESDRRRERRTRDIPKMSYGIMGTIWWWSGGSNYV